MKAFDASFRTRLVFGPGRLRLLGELAAELGGSRVLLVTDPGIVRAGHAERATESLRSAGLSVSIYADVRENPDTGDVDRCLEAARAAQTDLLVGLGGGSSMDTAKGCNFLLTNGGQMRDYWGIGKAARPMLPLIAVPTTAGTGSECQSFALIADAATHQKMACGDSKASAKVALLDPELTVSQPTAVTAVTGIDALTHAVETAVTRTRSDLSLLYSRQAFRKIIHHLPRVLDRPDDLEARAEMQLGAAYAGTAIELSMLGAAHAAANPLTAHHQVTHGQAVGMMLVPVMRFNAQDPDVLEDYAELAWSAGLTSRDHTPEFAFNVLVETIANVLARAGIRTTHLQNTAMASLGLLATEAATQWTAQHNPKVITAEDFSSLYSQVLASAG